MRSLGGMCAGVGKKLGSVSVVRLVELVWVIRGEWIGLGRDFE
jgi:phage shock protein PspC (stress-responsive transcriptional regulator)